LLQLIPVADHDLVSPYESNPSAIDSNRVGPVQAKADEEPQTQGTAQASPPAGASEVADTRGTAPRVPKPLGMNNRRVARADQASLRKYCTGIASILSSALVTDPIPPETMNLWSAGPPGGVCQIQLAK